MGNEVVIDQLMPFHKPNKKVSEKKMEHLIPQTKHNQSEPLLEQIDWVFTSVNWISVYPNTLLLPMARPTSEHIPCKIQIGPFLKPKFSDEIFWIEHPVFFLYC